MPLSAGDKLGPYEILAPIGAGGMGEVYKARDTKLDRDVAIKVLPLAFAQDPERLARFGREAKVLASLNHPNIAAIYGVEEHALVMELVEGVEPKGPMAFDEAWKIASQIASALEYAHDKNIVHRDLKPDNIKITPDGVVKLLDFGLAKAFTEQKETSGNADQSPTLTIGATEVGVILGTAAYMSPEQAKGKSVDKRADIWAFGVVLYELLTGERLFKGEDVPDTLAQVLTKEPSFDRVPIKARRLLKRCLQKDRTLRLGAISDARWMIEEGEAPVLAPAQQRRAWRFMVAATVGIALIATSIALAFVVFRSQPPGRELMNLSIPLPPGSPSFLVLSPDARRLAIVMLRERDMLLYLRSLDSPEYRPLPGTDGARMPFWSPDSRFIGFFAEGKLKTIPAAGGPATTLCGETGIGQGGTWNRAGVILFASENGKLRRVRAAGGECSPLALEDEGARTVVPEFLPDGNRFFYTTQAGVYLAALDNSKARKVLNDYSSVIYAPPSSGQRLAHLLFLRETTLLAQPFDPNKLEPVGDPVALAQQASSSSSSPQVGASITSNGTLVYLVNLHRQQQLTWLDRSGKELGRLGQPGTLRGVALSADGNTAAFGRFERPEYPAIWLYNIGRGSESRFASSDSYRSAPVWSPEGNRIAYSAGARLSLPIFVKDASGSGPEEALLRAGTNPRTPSDWSRDGKFLIYTENDPKTQADIWYLPDPGNPDRKPVKFLGTNAVESQAQLSPDGRWLAYTSSKSAGGPEVNIRPFPSGQGLWKVSVNGGREPRWSRNGKELFYLAGSSGTVGLMAVAVKADGSSLQLSAPSRLFEFQALIAVSSQNVFAYSPHPDGKRFLVSVQEAGNPAVNVITNWRKLLPAGTR